MIMKETEDQCSDASKNPLTTRKVEVRCRAKRCRRRLRLPAGKEGAVTCPHCMRRFWMTTKEQPWLLGTARVLAHNQEGIALCAAALLLLAMVWLPALYVLRQQVPLTIVWALSGSFTSWLLLCWVLEKPCMDNLLAGSLKEIRLFFCVLTAVFGVFAALTLWRLGTSDPTRTSHTLFELEALRNHLKEGPLLSLLKKPAWKFPLAVIALLSSFIQLNSLRRAVRGIATGIPLLTRIFVYALSAAAAFTFGGVLLDGAISRIEPVLTTKENHILQGFRDHVLVEAPIVIEQLADELIKSSNVTPDNNPPVRIPGAKTSRAMHVATNGESKHGPPDESPPIDEAGPPRPSGPSGPQDPKLPRGGGSGSRAILFDEWEYQFHQDAAAELRGIQTYESRHSDTSATPSYEFPAPATATSEQVDAFSRRPAHHPFVPAEPWDDDIKSLLVAGLDVLDRGDIPDTDDFTEHVATADPFAEQLDAMTEALASDPLKNVVKEVVAEVLSEALRHPLLNTRDWLKNKLRSLPAASPILILRHRIGSLRAAITGTFFESRSQGDAPDPRMGAAFDAIQGEYNWVWSGHLPGLPDSVTTVVDGEAARFTSSLNRRNAVDRALIETRLLAALSANAPQDSGLSAFENFEEITLGTAEIRAAALHPPPIPVARLNLKWATAPRGYRGATAVPSSTADETRAPSSDRPLMDLLDSECRSKLLLYLRNSNAQRIEALKLSATHGDSWILRSSSGTDLLLRSRRPPEQLDCTGDMRTVMESLSSADLEELARMARDQTGYRPSTSEDDIILPRYRRRAVPSLEDSPLEFFSYELRELRP